MTPADPTIAAATPVNDPPQPGPHGLAFVFTDIQGSTGLWQAVPVEMKRGLELHDAALRSCFARHRAYEFGTAGDAFKVVFAGADDAVRACLEVQARLLELPWPPRLLEEPDAAEVRHADGAIRFRGLRVRMGIHVGPAEPAVNPVTNRVDWFGPTVNTAARIGDAGHGGQIVISASAWAAATAASVPPEAFVMELGTHRLKGVTRAEELLQVLPAGAPGAAFPPLRTENARKSNVTTRSDAFVGRDTDRAALVEALGRGRLTTLLGPGGSGKTRLATELAAACAENWAGGAWFCDLATARSGMDVLIQLSEALRFPLPVSASEKTAIEIAGRAIASLGEALLVLDNFEQVVTHAAETTQRWLAMAPRVTLLITSREALGVDEEQIVELPPLSEPAAVELFVTRARAVRPGYDPPPPERARIAGLVHGLDRLPLAIELAASRLDVMSVDALSQRLGERFRLLSGAHRGRPDRQRTMRGAIDWSWDLLTPCEQSALAQCAVFRGGIAVDAAEAILDLSAFGDAPWPLDLVQALRRKSLLRAEPDRSRPRLGLYETILAYASEKLDVLGLREATELRHARWFADQADAWSATLRRPGDLDALDRMRTELPNLLAVHERMLQREPALAVRVIAALAPALEVFGPAPRYLEMIDASVAAAERVGDPELQVRALRGRAFALGLATRPRERQAALEQARELATRHGLPLHRAETLRELGMGAFYAIIPPEEGIRLLTEAEAEFVALEAHALRAITVMLRLGLIAARSLAPFSDEVELSRAIDQIARHGGERDLAWARWAQPLVVMHNGGGLERADELLRDQQHVHERAGDALNLGPVLAFTAIVDAFLGRREVAEAKFDRAEAITAPLAAPGRLALVRYCREALTLRDAIDAHAAGDATRRDALVARADAAEAALFVAPPDDPNGAPADRSSTLRMGIQFLRTIRSRYPELAPR